MLIFRLGYKISEKALIVSDPQLGHGPAMIAVRAPLSSVEGAWPKWYFFYFFAWEKNELYNLSEVKFLIRFQEFFSTRQPKLNREIDLTASRPPPPLYDGYDKNDGYRELPMCINCYMDKSIIFVGNGQVEGWKKFSNNFVFAKNGQISIFTNIFFSKNHIEIYFPSPKILNLTHHVTRSQNHVTVMWRHSHCNHDVLFNCDTCYLNICSFNKEKN